MPLRFRQKVQRMLRQAEEKIANEKAPRQKRGVFVEHSKRTFYNFFLTFANL
jgi:hypothetical protein